MLIKLADHHFIAADQIAHIKVRPEYERVIVTDKHGENFAVEPKHRENVYTALDRLVAEVNAALSLEGLTSAIDERIAHHRRPGGLL